MRDLPAIKLIGCDGSEWDLSGPNAGLQGVELMPKPQKLIDAPAKTFWIETNTGSHYQGFQHVRRDPTFTVFASENYEHDNWIEVESDFRLALGMYDEQFQIEMDVGDEDPRRLTMRLLEEPKSYDSQSWEGKAPQIFGVSSMMIAAAAEQPFWEAEPIHSSWTLPSGTSGSGTVYFENYGDVEVWHLVTVTAPANIWTLPDASWGNDYWGRADADANKTVPLPRLFGGEDLDIDTDPRAVKPWVARNGAPVLYRNKARMHVYPIPAHTPRTPKTVSVSGASAGATVTVTIPRRWSRPWRASR